MDHGEGGAATARLLTEVFLRHLGNPGPLEDAACLPGFDRIAFTTDTFVVRPPFFPGGDIGKLAVCGTVNDLAVMGAVPRWITAAFVLEEGLAISLLDRVVASMAATAREAGVTVVGGDTKVVGRGEADGIFVNTSGVGFLPPQRALSVAACRPGDQVIVSGPVGDHGTAVLLAREGFGLEGEVYSDCQPLGDLAAALLEAAPDIRSMRDPTRGGLATVLVEMASASGVRIRIEEAAVPVRRSVRTACDLLGLDPLYVACEGRLVVVCPPERTDDVLAAARAHPRGREAALIGGVGEGTCGLTLETVHGGRRPLVALEGAQLPRIC
ncbi:MAG: hydrogenase expression/formation protein HypE [Deltaproteobacteria bacterium]|nr:hydrogenase expression/formation protein HypE [Deltaproteobacteria bacterium]